MKIEQVIECSFQNWYKNFKNITIESIILPLPDGFIEYLLKDGVVLPQSEQPSYTVDANSSDESDSEVDWESSDGKESELPNFPELDEKIKAAIDYFDGAVFPKLNWSSPRDASWIALNNSCSCTSLSEIYLLLKSSDFIIHDLTKAFQDCEDYVQNEKMDSSLSLASDAFYLVLRKWTEIDTSGEFRCFVKNNNLIGVSQRDYSLYFDYIKDNRSAIIKDIENFFKKNIQLKFPSSDYTFDVYRWKEKCVRLLDFNPFGEVTDALLFTWDELKDGSLAVQEDELPVFRYIEKNDGVRPNPLSYHAIPKDIIDITTGEDSLKLIDLLKLKIEEQGNESSSDED